MTNVLVNYNSKSKPSVKAQTIATIAAIAAAVALPQLFHAVGAVSGLGTALGETFLPMHLPIILVGLFAGPVAGAVSGALGPLLSFMLTGMPKIVMLPFMMIELCVYGIVSGLLRSAKMPCVAKVLIAQVAGRAVRAVAILIGVNMLGSAMNIAVIWTSIAVGLPGLILQWALIPLIVYRVDNIAKN